MKRFPAIAIRTQPGSVALACALCRSVGLPISLRNLGIASLSPEQAREIAERAIAPDESSHNEPFELSVAAMQDALFAADAMGRDFAARHP